MNISEEDGTVTGRAMLVLLAKEVSFVAPREDQGLAEWADDVLDTMLPPRGGPTWASGHRWTIAAFEAAIHGQPDMCRAALIEARKIVEKYGRAPCKCERRTIPMESSGRKVCRVCFGRVA